MAIRQLVLSVTTALACATLPAAAQTNTFPATGNVGIGTTSPAYQLHLLKGGGSQLLLQSATGGSGAVVDLGFQTYSTLNGAVQPGARIEAIDDGAYSAHLTFSTKNPGADTNSLLERMRVQSNGTVGIGTTAPGAMLEVNGSIKLTSGSGASMTFADGTAQTTAWTGVLCGGDYSEAVNVKGTRKTYEPGDVLVIAGGEHGAVQKSQEPYSTMVAGIFATKPGVVGRRLSMAKNDEDVPMAMVGIVPAKVSAENGAVREGDLLVTSSTPGYAMKGTDRSKMLGAVIGKAMGSLDSGAGVIEVLVTLQ